jgi:sugar lactone lactonase YvrE
VQLPRPAILLLLACSVGVLHASSPAFWEVGTEAEFLTGEVENLSIDAFGRVTLGPTTTPVHDANVPFVWTLVAGPDGAIYAGSGNEGQVFRIGPEGRASVFFDADEIEVHALALAPDGGLYVGTSPNGKVYKVDRGGQGTVFFDPEDQYIWSLAVDAGGQVYVATGDRGVIYRVAPDGRGDVFYRTRATHAMSLAFDGEGRLLAGTASPGRLFRVDAPGRAFVVLDSSFEEIHALRVDGDGTVYAAAVRGRGNAAPQPPPAEATPAPTAGSTPTAGGSTQVTVTVAPQQTSTPPRTAGGSTGAAGAVFRILPDGGWDQIWESQSDTPYDVAVETSGALLVATGNDGKVFRLAGDPHQATLLTGTDTQQVTRLLTRPSGDVVLSTSNPGRLLRLSAARARSGTYLSTVRDARTVALWGTLRWRDAAPPGTRVEISTRSGNTGTPDETWSDWSPPYDDADGSAIVSPRARYLQWRAILSATGDASPVLSSVSAAYLPRNTRPRVTGIVVYPPGTVFQQQFPADPPIAGFDGALPQAAGDQGATAARGLGRRTYQQGLLTLTWRAEDENGDELRYMVEYRRESDTSWRVLREDMTETILVWDTASVPSGRYSVRVTASDAPSNATATLLRGLRESESFDVDNVPPEITVTSSRTEGDRLLVAFDVRDAHSGVRQVDYSLDGNRWQALYPLDGIADSRVERFELSLDAAAAAREVILRARDGLNNAASARGNAVGGAGAASGGR